MVVLAPMIASAVSGCATTARTTPDGEAKGTAFDTERSGKPSESGRTIKVFLLGGQSNMDGSGASGDLPPILRKPQDDILFFHTRSSSLTRLQPGTGSGFGPEITFGRTIADALPGESFALIKHAEGGTDLENQWDPAAGSSYAAFRGVVARGLDALSRNGYSVQIAGMLWTQGERDARMGFSATYAANLAEFIADIRSRYSAGLPFHVSQLSSLQTNLPAAGLAQVRAAQERVTAVDPNSHLIATDAFRMRPDNLHFSSAGNMALGRGFADSVLRQK